MTISYVLTKAASADLRDIARYTKSQWGAQQARKYGDALEQCAEAIALGKGRFTLLPEIRKDLRVMRCQNHYIYCLPRKGEPALILAVLHERMDLLARIANRLR